jgi:hypothetical protein
MRYGAGPSWQVTSDTPHTLVAALHLRDAAGLEVVTDAVVPQLEPTVALDAALVPYATAAAAAEWSRWWESLLDRHPEFRGVPPLVPDPFPELAVELRALIGTGLPAADAWFAGREREDHAELRRSGGRFPQLGVGDVVREVELGQARRAAPFDLLIRVLPVAGLWGRRVRQDHVLVSRALSRHTPGFEAFLEPVIRELAR